MAIYCQIDEIVRCGLNNLKSVWNILIFLWTHISIFWHGSIDIIRLCNQFLYCTVYFLFSKSIEPNSSFDSVVISCHYVWLSTCALSNDEWKGWIHGFNVWVVLRDKSSCSKTLWWLLTHNETKLSNASCHTCSIAHLFLNEK